MTPYQKTQLRIRHLADDLDRVSRQATFSPELRKYQLEKLTTSLTAQKRKLARLERQGANHVQ